MNGGSTRPRTARWSETAVRLAWLAGYRSSLRPRRLSVPRLIFDDWTADLAGRAAEVSRTLARRRDGVIERILTGGKVA